MKNKNILYIDHSIYHRPQLWYGDIEGKSVRVADLVSINKENIKIIINDTNSNVIILNSEQFINLKTEFEYHMENNGTIESYYKNLIKLKRRFKLNKIFNESL